MAQDPASTLGDAPAGVAKPASSPNRRRHARLAGLLCLFAALYAAFGVASPFLPALVAARGISAQGIGALFAAATVIRLVAAPVVGLLADRHRARRGALAACAGVAAVAALLYQPAASFTPILIVALIHNAALAPTTNLADALALLAVRPQAAWRYGWVRGTGSAAFIVGSLAAGVTISPFGLNVVLWLQAGLLIGVAIATRGVPPAPAAATPSAPSAPLVTAGSLTTLVRLAAFRRVLIVAALVLGSHALHDTFAVIRWRAANIDPATESLLWSMAVASEVLVFFLLGPYLLKRVGVAGAIAIAALAGCLRWGVAGATAEIAALALIQPLHGLTFALLHLACMRVIAVRVPPQLAASAQALYGTLAVGAATAVLVLCSGWLYASFGAHAFWAMGVLCLAALPLAAQFRDEPRV